MNIITALWAFLSPASFTGAAALLLAFGAYMAWPWTGHIAAILLGGLFLFFRSRRLFWLYAVAVSLYGIHWHIYSFYYFFGGY